ncbi:hypothetical protein HYX14_04060 [Candidatus Woesearchaeota archaeon]|nr:hypothetical protein [Candidatus Woesearchaeota archaeon]
MDPNYNPLLCTILKEDPHLTLVEYALLCTRGMENLEIVKDIPLEEKIPDRFSPNMHHHQELAQAERTLQIVEAMTLEQAAEEAEQQYQQAMNSYETQQHKVTELKSRYKSMLEQVRSWKPPTGQHQGLKEVMINQLKLSLENHCGLAAYCEPPKKIAPAQYRILLIEEAKRDVMYHKKEWREEVKKAGKATQFIRELVKSLPPK